MEISKLTSKCQVTIPHNIRNILDLNSGDRVEFVHDKVGHVYIKKLRRADNIYLKSLDSTLSEWSSEEDDDAYKDL